MRRTATELLTPELLKSELLGSPVLRRKAPPAGWNAAMKRHSVCDRIGEERGIDREMRTKVLHPSTADGSTAGYRVGMAKTEIGRLKGL